MSNENNLLPLGELPNDYKIEDEVLYLDKEKKEVIKKEDLPKLSIYDKMVLAAETMGIKLKKPKKSCKHCYERGYVSILENGQPVPCSCVFDKKDLNARIPIINHATKRRVQLQIRKDLKKQKLQDWINKDLKEIKVDE